LQITTACYLEDELMKGERHPADGPAVEQALP